jgi:NhaP-type Na+/H+ or K+/H+ antiporter
VDHGVDAVVIAVIAGSIVLWTLVSVPLERWNVTAPIAFVVMGVVATHGPVTVTHVNLQSTTVRSMAELTLALVLFIDASRVNARALQQDAAMPVRLLALGLPLTIAAGAGVAALLFGSDGIWVAAAIGAMVAPTDAALGASILQDEHIPSGVRRTLNIESGLNDGIATPFVNLFLAGALAAESLASHSVSSAVVDLVGGAAVGAAVGVAGALLLRLAERWNWSETTFRPLTVLALALLAYSAALIGSLNGFVAAFVGGFAFGAAFGPGEDGTLEFAEDVGTLLSLLVWFTFGAMMLVPGLQAADWRDLVFAVLALTVVRVVPVALALLGSGADRATVAFVGWFGPRGLATVVFGLIAYDTLAPPEAKSVLAAASVTVALSVLLHGITSGPFARRYGAVIAARADAGPEHTTAAAVRPRRPRHRRLLGR